MQSGPLPILTLQKLCLFTEAPSPPAQPTPGSFSISKRCIGSGVPGAWAWSAAGGNIAELHSEEGATIEDKKRKHLRDVCLAAQQWGCEGIVWAWESFCTRHAGPNLPYFSFSGRDLGSLSLLSSVNFQQRTQDSSVEVEGRIWGRVQTWIFSLCTSSSWILQIQLLAMLSPAVDQCM